MSSPFKDRLFRGYGPLVGFAAIFLAVVLLVPSQVPEGAGLDDGDASSVSDLIGDEGSEGTDAAGANGKTSAAGGADGSSGTKGKSGSSSNSGANGSGAGAAGDPAAQGNGANAGPAKVAGCGSHQIPGDPYSPPCVQFSGSNGGNTHRGVTEKEITVSVRIDGFTNGMGDALSKAVPGAKIPAETPEKIIRTIEGLVEYFNQRFQFYGRKIKLAMFDGKGDPLTEALGGGGQEGAQADALKAAEELQAFADFSAISPPYADALSSKGVINTGAPFVPREWLASRRPYSWTQFTDCSTVTEAVSSFYIKKMAGQPAANAGTFNGQPMNTQGRRLAIVAPSQAIYQQCVGAGRALLKQAGADSDTKLDVQYELSVPNAGFEADNVLTKLKESNITTIICGCDPIFLAQLTPKMANIGYFPEMIVTGVALMDVDLVGQLFHPEVWRRAFGVSFLGPTQAEGTSLGFRAYKSIRPDQPSVAVDLIYNQLYLLAIGFQMAGPNLNPASFEKGMFDYPTRVGEFGSWGFAPNDYSTSDDAREVHWNPNATSIATRSKGAYIDSNGGARFPIGSWPGGNPKFAG